MQPLIIVKTISTPAVLLNNQTGSLVFTGRSLPEDAYGFYQPVMEWVELYLLNPNASTNAVFELEYFNSASSKIFITLFHLLEGLFNKGLEIRIDWRYAADDTDTLEAGVDFASLLQIPFVFTQLQNNY